MQRESPLQYLRKQLFTENQVLVAILGICSALAITNRLSLALTMGIAVILTTSISSLCVSLLRHKTPDSIRLITQITIIALLVSIIDQFLQAYLHDISRTLSIFVGLIITNCIVLGRTESLARQSRPILALMDGLGAGLGYTWVICSIAIIREFFGFGEFFGMACFPKSIYASLEHPERYQNMLIMLSPPGAFFLLGLGIAMQKIYKNKKGLPQ